MGSLACGNWAYNERTIGDIECLTVFSKFILSRFRCQNKEICINLPRLKMGYCFAVKSTPSNSRRLPMYPTTGLPLNSSFILDIVRVHILQNLDLSHLNNDNFVWVYSSRNRFLAKGFTNADYRICLPQ